tara:strand:- start:842 stop:988 length:147 start_codon:yes stop_codon:yes gene_type:complete
MNENPVFLAWAIIGSSGEAFARGTSLLARSWRFGHPEIEADIYLRVCL